MILVTGATGLVGSYLLHSLLLKGENVSALLYNESSLDRTRRIFKMLGSNPEELISKVKWIKGDVLDVPLLYESMKDVDHVYHCAAIVSFDPEDRSKMMNVNVEGTKNVVNVALERNVTKLCYVSSIAALGRTDNSKVIDENSEWNSSTYNSNYARSKYMAEREVWRASAEGLPVIIVNPGIIFGYGHPQKGSTKMFTTIRKISYFYGKGINAYVDVRDVVEAMITLMNSDIKNERFVVSAGNFSYKEIFSMIAEGFNRPAPRFEVPDFALDVVWRFEALRSAITKNKPLITRETSTTSRHNFYYSNNKLIKVLNYKFRPIEDTIGAVCKAMIEEVD